jgi:hypothetical protein
VSAAYKRADFVLDLGLTSVRKWRASSLLRVLVLVLMLLFYRRSAEYLVLLCSSIGGLPAPKLRRCITTLRHPHVFLCSVRNPCLSHCPLILDLRWRSHDNRSMHEALHRDVKCYAPSNATLRQTLVTHPPLPQPPSAPMHRGPPIRPHRVLHRPRTHRAPTSLDLDATLIGPGPLSSGRKLCAPRPVILTQLHARTHDVRAGPYHTHSTPASPRRNTHAR